MLALLRGNDEGRSSTLIISLFAGTAALLLVFVAIERTVREPMLPLALFKIPSFTGVQLAAFAVSVSLFATLRHLTLYLQNYLGYSPFQTGLRYLPITVLAFLFSAGVGALIGRVPARLLLSAGLAMTGTGLVLMSGIKVRVGMDDAARRLSRRRRGHRRPGLRRRHAWKRTNAQRLSDRGTHELLVFQRRELNPPNAAWEPIDHLRRRAQCEPRLAAAPSTSQGDQTVGPQRALQFIQLAPAAHEASQQIGKIVRPRVAQQQ